MKKSVAELAEMVGGTFVGEGTLCIEGASPMHNAGSRDITFLEKLDKFHQLQKSKAAAAVLPLSAQSTDITQSFNISYIFADPVLESFEKIVRLFLPAQTDWIREISPQAVISDSAKIGKDVLIGPCAVIGDHVEIGDHSTIHGGVQIFANCKIGANTTIYPNAVLYENSMVGSHCILHANCVIGAFGFGYDSSQGTHRLSSQLGNVIIADSVEIGSCSTIDRGTYGSTQIGEGTKVDNLVMIAHNCKIGKYNLICAHTGIAGSTTTGDYVVMAGRVGVRDHVHIGDRAVLGAMAGVMSDVPEGVRWVGIPATPEKEQMKKQVALAKLPEMRKELIAIQQQVQALEKKIAQ